VGPVVVVLRLVLLNRLLGVADIDKVVLGEALTLKAVVEALDGRVIARLAGPTEVHAHVVPTAPVVERDRRELGAVATLNDRGDTALVPQLTQGRDDVFGAQSEGRYQADAFARVEIDDAQHAKRRAIGQLIVDEVHRPALIRRARLHAHDARGRTAAPFRLLPLLGQALVAIEASHALVIDGPPFAAEQDMQAPVGVGDAGLRQLAESLPQRLIRGCHARLADT